MSYQLSVTVNLRPVLTGLTLEALLLDADGAAVGSPVTAGFSEQGAGHYLWKGAIPDNHQGSAIFRENGETVVLAAASINPREQEWVDARLSTIAAAILDYTPHRSVAYNESADTLSINAWLELEGRTVTNPDQCDIDVRDDAGVSLHTDTSTTEVDGVFKFVWATPGLVTGVNYQVKVTVTVGAQTYVNSRNFVTAG